MSVDDTPFKFTSAWHELGIVTPARLATLQAIWDVGDDPHDEHYRFLAFKDFLSERRPVSSELAVALYELGAADADVSMGESMMHTIAELEECPPEVLERARASGRKHLVKAASRHTTGGRR